MFGGKKGGLGRGRDLPKITQHLGTICGRLQVPTAGVRAANAAEAGSCEPGDLSSPGRCDSHTNSFKTDQNEMARGTPPPASTQWLLGVESWYLVTCCMGRPLHLGSPEKTGGGGGGWEHSLGLTRWFHTDLTPTTEGLLFKTEFPFVSKRSGAGARERFLSSKRRSRWLERALHVCRGLTLAVADSGPSPSLAETPCWSYGAPGVAGGSLGAHP